MTAEKLLEHQGAILLAQSDGCAVWQFRNETSDGKMTTYEIFSGVMLAFYDFHMERYECDFVADRRMLAIDHCREGRIAYPYGDACFFLSPGDLAIVRRSAAAAPARFPTGHYHGITVSIDPARAPDCLSCFLEDVEVRPSALIEKFCADSACFVTRSSQGVAHIFAELYSVPEAIRKGYFKVKILELLLFLSAFPVQAAQPQHSYPQAQVQLAEQIGAYLLENTERRLTVAELSQRFGASATLINSSFRGVYGMSPAAFLRAQKMHGAARLLRQTDRTVLDIAGQFGYDNGSKFAKAFRDVIGVSPNAYRSGIDCDSCAPEAPAV